MTVAMETIVCVGNWEQCMSCSLVHETYEIDIPCFPVHSSYKPEMIHIDMPCLSTLMSYTYYLATVASK